MQLEHSFSVPVPVDEAWQALLDVHRIAPCLPGATLTESAGDTFAGKVKLKIGPINAAYAGSATLQDVDDQAHTVTIVANGKEQRGSGSVAALIRPRLTEVDGQTRVDIVTDVDITGRAAQFGRGIIADVSSRLVGQFAENLSRELTKSPTPALEASSPASAGAPSSAASSSAAGPASSSGDAAAESRASNAQLSPPQGETSLDVTSLLLGDRGPFVKGFALGVLVCLAIRGLSPRRV